MTNLFSGILAIIIALTSMCGGLAGSNLEKAVNLEGGITLDGELSTLILVNPNRNLLKEGYSEYSGAKVVKVKRIK